MKNTFLLFALVFITTFLTAQSRQAQRLYQQGINAFEKQNHEEAIRLFTLSVEEQAFADAFYKRAIAYAAIGDSCGYCLDLLKAFQHGNRSAQQLYLTACTSKQSTNNINDSIRKLYPYAIHMEITHHNCLPDSVVEVISHPSSISGSPEWPEIKDLDESTEEILLMVDELPVFPGGQKALFEYIAYNIKYPESARLNKISGVVYVSFVVRNDGYVSNVSVARGVHPDLDEEAVQLIRNMPRWGGGKHMGKPVHVRQNIPIRFQFG